MRLEISACVAALGVSVFGCATWSLDRVTNFRATSLARAAFELQCPPEQVQVKAIPHDSYDAMAVQGCGKRAVFVQLQGQWIGESGPIPEEPQPAH
jgi:hypothetical protein